MLHRFLSLSPSPPLSPSLSSFFFFLLVVRGHAASSSVVGFQFRCELSLLGAFRAGRQDTFICAWRLHGGMGTVGRFRLQRSVLPLKLQVMMLSLVCCLHVFFVLLVWCVFWHFISRFVFVCRPRNFADCDCCYFVFSYLYIFLCFFFLFFFFLF